ncbi:hypothetical protein [Nocardia sp. NPDC057668]|uniref:hypothetical protein n=1 Tax=Nocardia sp. NPDC057668 TaxID=3346202 RepID=UPI0036728A89
MTTDLAAIGGENSGEFAVPAVSPGTRRMYDSSWRRFESWCAANGCVSLPADAESVIRYLTEAATPRGRGERTYRTATFGVWLAAIGDRHQAAGFPHPGRDPRVTLALRDIRARAASAGSTPAREAPRLSVEELSALVAGIEADARGWAARALARRDIALLVLGSDRRLNHSALTRLYIEDVGPDDGGGGEGLRVRIRRTRGDGAEYVFLAKDRSDSRRCPPCVVHRWLCVLAAYDRAESGAAEPDRLVVPGADPTAPGEAGTGIPGAEGLMAVDLTAGRGALAVTRLMGHDDVDPEEHSCETPLPDVPSRTAPLFRPMRGGVPHEKQPLTASSVGRVWQRRAAAAVSRATIVAEPGACREAAAREHSPVQPDSAVAGHPVGLAERYHRGWATFARWCAATDRRALPATPTTVAAYLHEHPGKTATQRGRLTAVNQAHIAAGLPAPGRAAALRGALNAHRAHRHSALRRRVERLLPQLPVWGWTAGLFGRRNAALLVLAAAGLTYPQIAALTQRDLRSSGEHVIVGDHLALLEPTGDPATCPIEVLCRWTDALRLAPHPAGRGRLAHHLGRRDLPATGLDVAHEHLPLFTSFDSRGYTPMHDYEMLWLQPLSATAIAAIVAAHVRGPVPAYRLMSEAARTEQLPEPPEPVFVEPILADTYDAGIAARHRDHERLDDLDELWDDFDDQADEVARMLERALALAQGTPDAT